MIANDQSFRNGTPGFSILDVGLTGLEHRDRPIQRPGQGMRDVAGQRVEGVAHPQTQIRNPGLLGDLQIQIGFLSLQLHDPALGNLRHCLVPIRPLQGQPSVAVDDPFRLFRP